MAQLCNTNFSTNLLKDFENYKDLHNLKLIIVVQHPRQYALEVANQRSELPDSGLYLDILKEYVQLVTNLISQCDSINLIKSGKFSNRPKLVQK